MTLKNNSASKDKLLFSPLLIGLYYFLVFGLGIFLDLSLMKTFSIFLLPILTLWVMLDFSKNLVLLFTSTYWYIYYFKNGYDSIVISSYTMFVPIAILCLIMNHFMKKDRVESQDNNTLFYLWIAFSVLISTILARRPHSSMYSLFIVTQFFFFYYWFKSEITDIQYLKKLYTVFLSASFLPILVGLTEVFSNNSIDRVSAFAANPNEFAAFIAFFIFMIIPIIFLVKKRYQFYFLLVILFISIVVLFSTQSRAGQLSIAGSLFVYFVIRGKGIKSKLVRIVFLILLGVLLVLAFGNIFLSRFANINNLSYSEYDRIGMWIAAWKLFKQSPIFGIGINNYYYYYPVLHPFFDLLKMNQLAIAHNLFLNTLAEMGMICIVALSFIYLIISKRIFSLYKNANRVVLEIAKASTGFFVYFFIHNTLDCPWNAFAHEVPKFQFMLFILFIFHVPDIIEKKNA